MLDQVHTNGASPDGAVASAAPLGIRLDENSQLWAARESEPVRVKAVPCFPWSDPSRHISLRDGKENEIALVHELEDLNPESRAALLCALAQARFLLEIEQIDSIETEFEIRNWKVRTRQGPCIFQTKIADWPREIDQGGILIRDVVGNLYFLADLAALDKKGRALIWPLVD